jgi:hypothetical protein
VTEQQLRAERRSLRDGRDPSPEILKLLRDVVHWMVRGGLPLSYSPYGSWNDEAEEDLFQGWMTDRLVTGGLLSMVDRARTAGALRRMAELSLRQWLLNQRTRSQAQNLYWRLRDLLAKDEQFVRVRDAHREADSSWALADAPDAGDWTGDDRRLLSVAWSLGDFEVVRYKPEAKKLSPLLSTPELTRFAAGMLSACGRLTLAQLVRALELRFDLVGIDVGDLDAVEEPKQPQLDVDEEVVLGQTVAAIMSQLTRRQAQVVLETRAELTLDEMAEALGCSPATISNEQRRIAALVDRHSETDDERNLLLRMLGDALYEESEPS